MQPKEPLDQYSYLWDGTDPGWALLKSADLPGGLCIYNTKGAVLLIEDGELNRALCERLKQEGVRVFDEMPAVKL